MRCSLAPAPADSRPEFSEAVVKCLPQLPYTIPEREYSPEVRRDYREHTVFTIDPETARDLDDALHVVKNEDGTFEVGVHIADVTHFVKVRPAPLCARIGSDASPAGNGTRPRGPSSCDDSLPRAEGGPDAAPASLGDAL